MLANLWFTVLLMLIMPPLLAQPFTSRSLSIQHGLPEFYVTGLIQDKAGFVWIATRDGLARYDGRRFKIFRHQPHTRPSIASNIILSLQLVSDTTILIHLENDGFQRLNPITEQFSDVLTNQQLAAQNIEVAGATLTPDGKDFWGRHQARLIHYLPHQKQLTTYPLPPIRLPENAFIGNASVLTTQANLYAPFPGGLLEFNTRTHRFRQFTNPAIDAQPVVETYYGTPIIQRAMGELLIGGARQLIAFNPFTHRFRSIPVPNPVNTQVGFIHAGIDGSIYFTLAMTVYRMTPDDQITPLWTAPRIDYRNYFHALLLDRSGVLWVGTNGDGVQQIDLHSLPVKVYPYQTNFVADVFSRELGLSTPDWVKAYDIPYRLRTGGAGLYGTAWFGQAYHLFRLDLFRHGLRYLLSIPRPKEYRVSGEGNGMRVLPTGHIWMYDLSQGLIRTDTAGRQPAVFPCSIHWVSDLQPLGSWVWISSEFDGLYAYDPSSRRIVRHLRYQPTDSTSLCSNHIGCLTADPFDPAVLWVGTQEGLSRLDTRSLRCQNWTEKQGLPSATINTLLTDRRGWLWFSTLKGISRLDPQRRRMRHFSTADGLLDIEYKPYLGAQLPDGRLAFGGLNGLTVFDPLALKEALPSEIPVVLTALRIANVTIEPHSVGSPLHLPLNATTTLQLKYTQNFLSLEFAGLQYNKPASLQYRYQLTGVDANWVYSGGQTVANYTQLAPGAYQFRVNAADAGGRWSRLVKTLRIVIVPPWWRTGWFYGLVTIVTLSAMYGLYRYRLAQVLKLYKLRNDIARDLHDEVGSSISSIAIYAKIVLQQVGASTFNSEPLLLKITEQANDIMGSMNDIVWSINTKNDAFEQVFIRIREHALQLLEPKGYTLHFDFDEALHHTKLTMEKRRDVYLIYKEALNNIAKYANGRNVWISVHLRNASIDLLIRDDGRGFAPDAVGGQGNGLRNMRYRATTLTGTLRIVSEPDRGTTLQLSF